MIEERMPGTNPLFETRKESELQVDRQKRYKQITEILKDNPDGLTAKGTSVEMKNYCRETIKYEIYSYQFFYYIITNFFIGGKKNG